jgi:hypothetical protein
MTMDKVFLTGATDVNQPCRPQRRNHSSRQTRHRHRVADHRALLAERNALEVQVTLLKPLKPSQFVDGQKSALLAGSGTESLI